MSSWIVGKATIDLMVEAVFRYEVPTRKTYTPDALGALLWKENVRGVNYRYSQRSRTPSYTHTPDRPVYGLNAAPQGTVRELVRDPLFVWQQVRCLRYQSCDAPTWHTSMASSILDALEAAVLRSAGMDENAAHDAIDRHAKPYPWGIEYGS